MPSFNNDSTIPNQVLSHHNISEEMNSVISELEPLLPISKEKRRMLLLKFNWDIESLKNSFQEYADTNSFLLENDVCPNDTVSVKQESECAICCSTKRVLGLRCQHMACVNCWSKYLTAKIKNNQCMLSCIGFECSMLITNDILGSFLCSFDLQTAHRKLIEESYINNNSSLAWCNKKCGMAVRRLNQDTVTCSCGSTFCFLCKSDAHHPATCRQIRDWEKQHWILSNTKECPKCFITILKDGGCNHMRCTGCRYEYCWVCLRNWKTHSGGCERAETAVAQSRPDPSSNSDTFARYAASFDYHKKCLEREQQTLSGFSYTSTFKFRKTLDECRRTLMYSYIFGYYLKDEMRTRLLVKHQQKLAFAVVNLDAYRTGSRAETLANECLTFRKAILDHCAGREEHENLEGRQPVESVTIDTNSVDSVEISSAIIFGFSLIAVWVGFPLIVDVFDKIRK